MKALNPIIILRLGIGLCFIGHGVLALNAKAKFVELLGTLGLNETTATTALIFIGVLDVLIGLMIMLKPSKLALQWAMLWTSLTILAWAFHGDTLMDLLRRVPYVAGPFALLVMLYYDKAEGSKQETTNAKHRLPTPQQLEAIDRLDLTMIARKLMDTRDGEGWSQQQCNEVMLEYRRYLKLNLLYPDANIVPNLAVDTVWHYHILDTEAYYRDCHAIFGHLLHHYPYFGMGPGESEQRQFMGAFDQTKILYERTFAIPMEGPSYLPSFQRRA